MRVEVELRTAVIILLGVLLVTSAGSIAATELLGPDQPTDHSVDVVDLYDGSELWPYTSRTTSFDQRTLSLNVVIYGDANLTEFVLRGDPHRQWRDVPEDREDIAPAEEAAEYLNETLIGLAAADGADRWVWVDPPGQDPQWLSEAYQLEEGDYLGHRHHIRAYVDPSEGSWTALQGHTEHWDWFHLRHSVHTVEETQIVVEDAFYDRAYVDQLYRDRFGNDQSSDADGWVTIITLDEDVLPLLFGMLTMGILGVVNYRQPMDRVHELRTDPSVIMAGRLFVALISIVLVYHFVRFGAIGVERLLPGIPPKLIVVLFYPILVIGLPIVAYITSRPLSAHLAFLSVTLGFVIAVFIDYTYLEVIRLPLETIVHRGVLAAGIGMIAAGASATARDPNTQYGYVRTGVLLWSIAIALPLGQFL